MPKPQNQLWRHLIRPLDPPPPKKKGSGRWTEPLTLPAHEANMYEAPTVPRLSAKKWGTQAAWGGSGALGARRRGESDVTMAPRPPAPQQRGEHGDRDRDEMARALWGAGAAVCRRGGRSPAEPTRRRSHVLKACRDVPAEEVGRWPLKPTGPPA